MNRSAIWTGAFVAILKCARALKFGGAKDWAWRRCERRRKIHKLGCGIFLAGPFAGAGMIRRDAAAERANRAGTLQVARA